MQTSEVQTGILLQLPEAMRTALNAYAVEKSAPIESVIELAIANLLAEPQRAIEPEEDPAIGAFLNFLEKDIIEHPDRLQSFDPEWVKSAFELVEGVEVDIDAPLPDESELQDE
jgi:prlF antitoxin for toxin YhaV_toxin